MSRVLRYLDMLGSVMTSVNQVLSSGFDLVETVSVGAELLLEVGVLLQLATNVGGIHVALVLRGLQLLVDPAEHFIAVAVELLKTV